MYFKPPSHRPRVGAAEAAARVKAAIVAVDNAPRPAHQLVEATRLSWDEVDDGLLRLRDQGELKILPSDGDGACERFMLIERATA